MFAKMFKSRSTIIDYVNLIHQSGGHEGEVVKDFREAHKKDLQFQKRADTFNQLWDARDVFSSAKLPVAERTSDDRG